MDRGEPDEPERRRGVLAAGPLVGRRRARPVRRGQPRRRRDVRLLGAPLQQLRRAAPRPTAGTTAAPRTRGSRGRPTATCGRSPSGSIARRRATPCWRRACAMAARRGASRSSCAATTRGRASRSPTTSTTRSRLTADPTDASGNLVYAVWDRFVSPNQTRRCRRSSTPAPSTDRPGSRARPTGAAATPAWEPARPIYDPGVRSQTISNQIVVHPDGTLIDGFYLFKSTGAQADRGTSIAAIRSTDKGATWSKKAITIAPGELDRRDRPGADQLPAVHHRQPAVHDGALGRGHPRPRGRLLAAARTPGAST